MDTLEVFSQYLLSAFSKRMLEVQNLGDCRRIEVPKEGRVFAGPEEDRGACGRGALSPSSFASGDYGLGGRRTSVDPACLLVILTLLSLKCLSLK